MCSVKRLTLAAFGIALLALVLADAPAHAQRFAVPGLGGTLNPYNYYDPYGYSRQAAFNIALYTLLPFGRKAVSRAEYLGVDDFGTGPFGAIGNIIWLVLAGWWLALLHLFTAVLLAVTIIGIPFAWAHLKLAGIALWPIGKMIVDADETPQRYRQGGRNPWPG